MIALFEEIDLNDDGTLVAIGFKDLWKHEI